MKKFKKIYLEITNGCNLNCDFCIKNNRKVEYINIENFKIILNKLKKYTDYLYFHVLGEPLLHPQINELIDIASNDFKINITTNGYLINNIKTNNIRQINISLHSFNDKYNINITTYLDNIFNKIDSLEGTYISLRLWVKNKYNKNIIKYINKRYNICITKNTENYTVNDHIFINNFHEFTWPDLDNDYCDNQGTCYGLIDHIGILVDGTIIPCCLDSKGVINLGNIYIDNIEDILNSNRVISMINGFKNNKKYEELCKHCNFIEKK